MLGAVLLELNTSDADIGMNTHVEYIIVDGSSARLECGRSWVRVGRHVYPQTVVSVN